MPLLSLDQIPATLSRAHLDVDVPEWGGSLRVWETTAGDEDALQDSIYRHNRKLGGGLQLSRCLRVAFALGDAEGKPLFPDPLLGVADVAKWPASIVQRLFDAAMRLNALTREDAKGLEKNSDAAEPAA